MGVSPMRWWSDRQLARVAARIEDSVAAWSEAWGGAASVSVECVREHESKDAANGRVPWLAFAADTVSGRHVRLRAAPALRASVFDALFGARPIPAVGDELAADRLAELAWDELQERLRSACLLPAALDDDGPPTATRARPWSGALVAGVSCGPIRLALRLDAACVAAMLATAGEPEERALRADAPPLANLADALRGRTVRIRTTVAAGDLDLGSLQALAVGDVIRLPHSLDRPLAVQADEEPLPCGAYLGQRDGQRAIELAHRTAQFETGEAP